MRGCAAACFFAIGLIAMSGPSRADTIQLYAAGSLRAALTEAAKSFEAKTGHGVQAKYGPSGVLRDEIADGARSPGLGCRLAPPPPPAEKAAGCGKY
jgi:molybdate transport system substrate-binding protein